MQTQRHALLPLSCNKHGAFSLSARSLKDYLNEGACPACRVERKSGVSVPSNELLLAIRGALTNADERKQQGLDSAMAKLEKRFGAGVLAPGPEPFEGLRGERTFECLTDPEHGGFKSNPERLLRLVSPRPCPRCRKAAYTVELSDMPSEMRRPGGYLYSIVDFLTSMKYMGLTVTTPEERYEGHLEAISRGSNRPLYAAMRERPDDFKLVPIAYYYDLVDLQKAEQEAIAQSGTKWPLGYNLTDGGELSLRVPPKFKIQAAIKKAYGEATPAEAAEILAIALRKVHKGAAVRKVLSLIRRCASKEEFDTPRIKPSSALFPEIVVHGVTYTKGLRAVCKELSVCPKRVKQFAAAAQLSWESQTGLAIEGYLHQRKAYHEAFELTVEGVSYKSRTEAREQLGLSKKQLEALLAGHSLEQQASLTAPCNREKAQAAGISIYAYRRALRRGLSAQDIANGAVAPRPAVALYKQAKELGLSREMHRLAVQRGLSEPQMLQLSDNLAALVGKQTCVHVEGTTYPDLHHAQQVLGLSRHQLTPVLRGNAALADVQLLAQEQGQLRQLRQTQQDHARELVLLEKGRQQALRAEEAKSRKEAAAQNRVLAAQGKNKSQRTPAQTVLRPATSVKAWQKFQAIALAFYETHGHLRFTRAFVDDKVMDLSESLRAKWREGRLEQPQIQWMAERGYCFDARGEKQSRLEEALALVAKFVQGVKLADEETALARKHISNWVRGVSTGELSFALRSSLVALNFDWRFSSFVFDLPVFSQFAARTAASLGKSEVLPADLSAWVRFVRQCLKRRTLPAACAQLIEAQGLAAVMQEDSSVVLADASTGGKSLRERVLQVVSEVYPQEDDSEKDALLNCAMELNAQGLPLKKVYQRLRKGLTVSQFFARQCTAEASTSRSGPREYPSAGSDNRFWPAVRGRADRGMPTFQYVCKGCASHY